MVNYCFGLSEEEKKIQEEEIRKETEDKKRDKKTTGNIGNGFVIPILTG